MVSLENQLTEIHKKKDKIFKEIDEKNKEKIIECSCCGNSYKIKNLTAIQTYWYTDFGNCEHEGELQFVCPGTGIVNGLLFDNDDIFYWGDGGTFKNDPERQFKEDYRKLFKEVKYSYDEKLSGERVNNFYVDGNRKEFGLVEKIKVAKK
ncbi:hypothetical protein KAI32_00560 [Candidatus Pacearchaeota archaeon]|nr:hypothetical protein [Candidatus Pacearchaeota archaeon]